MRTGSLYSCSKPLFVLLALIPLHAGAVTLTLDAVDRGSYDDIGSHDAADDSYRAGFVGGAIPLEYRDFFVFDLSVLNPGDVIDSARLHLWNPAAGYTSPDAFEIYSLYDVSTPIADLTSSSAGDPTIFPDLGSGTTYRGLLVTAIDNDAFIDIPINKAGTAAMTGAIGGLFAFGGALGSIDVDSEDDQFVFGDTGGGDLSETQLILDVTPVPVPAAAWLLGSSLLGLVAVTRRRPAGVARLLQRSRGLRGGRTPL